MTDDKPDPTEEKRAWLRELIARSETHSKRIGFVLKRPATDNHNRSK